jgi:endonuclease/exonuclease/phosphatase (EEP) superfamily protein YafD
MNPPMGLGAFSSWLKTATVFGAAGVGAAMLAGPFPVFDIVSHARIPIGVLLLALGLFHLPSGRPRWAAGAFLAGALSLAPAWSFVSTAPAHAAEGRTLRVLFHNAWMRNEDPARVLALVRATKPDVVALIEVRRDWHPALDTLADLYPYRVMEPRYGETVILSKTPLDPSDVPGAGASIVFADIERPDGRAIRITVSHFTRPWPWDDARAQRRQLARFADAWRGRGKSDIVVGDFNGAPWSPPLETLTKATGLRPVVGAGGTWPTFLPAIFRLPIDNAFVSARVKTVHREVLGHTGSDHAPVLYDMVLTD